MYLKIELRLVRYLRSLEVFIPNIPVRKVAHMQLVQVKKIFFLVNLQSRI